MPDQCYFLGDFWQCVTATLAGQSPTSIPGSWRKITLPSKFRWVLAQLTYASLLRLDGQTDKANVERAIGYGHDRTGLDDLIRQEGMEQMRRSGGAGNFARVNTGRTMPVKASVILDDAIRLIGWDTTQIDSREFGDARMALSESLQEVWEAWWWQELMICEPTAFAQTFGTAMVGQCTIYWPGTDNYYWNKGFWKSSDPLPIQPTTGGVINPDWYLRDPAGEVLAPPWVEGKIYTKGDVLRYENGIYVAYNATASGQPMTGAVGGAVDPAGFLRFIDWQPTLPYLSLDGTTWLGRFGPIRSVSKFDPRTADNPEFYEVDVSDAGTRVLDLDVGRPWVWTRRVTPVLTGDAFDAAATYDATFRQNLVYDTNPSLLADTAAPLLAD